MKINYGIIAFENVKGDLTKINVVHNCMYENEPSEDDFESLFKELNSDPEFGLVGRMGKDVFLMKASPEMVKYIIDQLGTDTLSDDVDVNPNFTVTNHHDKM
jgi:hypothetical protein